MRIGARDVWLILITIISYVYLAYFATRDVAFTVLLPVLLLFVIYYTVVTRKVNSESRIYLVYMISLAVIGRLMFMLSEPILSDDFFRFFWDAKLFTSGQNPFGLLPAEMGSLLSSDGTAQEVLRKMNSPNYYTVYPAVLQFVFGLAYWLSSGVVGDFILWLRLIYLVFDLGTLFVLLQLLKVLKLSPYYVALYALNPLVIIEGVGNLHPETLMLFFLSLGLYFIFTNKYFVAGIFIGLSISTKLLPLILLPSIWNYVGSKRFLYFILGAIPLMAILHIPFFSFDTLLNAFDSISLYFNSFEFNASLYFLLSAVGTELLGYNPIHILGPVLAVITFLIIVYLSFKQGKNEAKDLISQWVLIFTVYYFMATTVHPWYIMPLVLFCVVSQSYIYPLLWSALIFLSYIQYHGGNYEFSAVVVTIEYILLGVAIVYEKKRKSAELVQNG